MSKNLTSSAAAVKAYIEQKHPQLVEEWRAAGVAAEADRLTRLEAVTMPGYEHLLARARAEGWTPERLAVEQVSSERVGAAQALRMIAMDEELLEKPRAAASEDFGGDFEVNTAAGKANVSKVKRILNAGKAPGAKMR